jgi:hypothetical protein
MPYMWADTLLSVERAHVLRLLAWSAASILGGTGIVAWLGAGGRRSPLLFQFALLTAAWGGVNAIFAFIARAGLAPRDLAAATRLDRVLWLNIGLDVGYVLVGATLAVAGWRLGRRLGLVGAGLAVIVQGTALAWLDLVLAAQISR